MKKNRKISVRNLDSLSNNQMNKLRGGLSAIPIDTIGITTKWSTYGTIGTFPTVQTVPTIGTGVGYRFPIK